MTVEERVAKFLRDHTGDFCDACIAEQLQLGSGRNRTMARNATAALGTTSDFHRAEGLCSNCGQRRKVTRFVSPS